MHLFLALSICFSVVIAVPVSVDRDSNPEESGFFEGDIVLEPGEEPYHRNGATNHKRIWPNGVVPYTIDAAHQKIPRHVQHIHDAMNEIMQKTQVNGKKCIDFQPHNSSSGAYIQFRNGTGCSSGVGYHAKHKAHISLGNGCLGRGTVIHEILHTLGFWHEQSRSDRDSYVTIKWHNIKKGRQGNFMKHHRDNLNMPYDYKSVMHYDAYAFSNYADRMTIEPKQGGIHLGQRSGLTNIDRKKIQILYGCIPRPKLGAVTTANPFGRHITPKISNITAPPAICTFDSGLCGWLQSTQDDIDWTTGQGFTPSRNTGPHTDHSSYNGGHYLYLEASKNIQKTGILVSPTYAGGTFCFSVWYNMNGRHMGSLTFAIIQREYKQTLTYLHGRHGDKWLHYQRQITIPSSTPLQFLIEGRVGSSFTSDMAIDDVAVTPGKCASG